MAGLLIPEDFPLTKLEGQEVTQVCIGLNQVQLHFYRPVASASKPQWEPGARIEIEAGFVLRQPNLEERCVYKNPIGKLCGQLTVLLGETVTSVSRLDRNELLIQFSTKIELQLLTDEQGFESYHLHIEGNSVDVTKPW